MKTLSWLNKVESELTVFERIERYKVRRKFTWRQVAILLGLSVPTLMMVKAGTRELGGQALYRLQGVEKMIESQELAAAREECEAGLAMLCRGLGTLLACEANARARLSVRRGRRTERTGVALPMI